MINPSKFSRGSTNPNILFTGVLVAISLLAMVLLFLGQYVSQERHTEEITKTVQQSVANNLNQSFAWMTSLTQAAASQPNVVDKAMSTGGNHLVDLNFSPFIKAAYVFQVGTVEDQQGEHPLSFAAAALLKSIERGESARLEAYKAQGKWWVYSPAAIKNPEGKLLGTLMLVLDPMILTASLPQFKENDDYFQLIQQKSGAGYLPILTDSQAATINDNAMSLKNPGWLVRAHLTGELFSIGLIFIPLAVLILFLGAVLLIGYQRKLFSQTLNADVLELKRLASTHALHHSAKLNHNELIALTNCLSAQPIENTTQAETTTQEGTMATNAATDIQANAGNQSILHDVLALDNTVNNPPPAIEVDEISQDDLGGTGSQEPDSSAHAESERSAVPASIFRAYDIRGIIDETLTTSTTYWIGRSIGSTSCDAGETKVVVARDGRLSGPSLVQSLTQGLIDAGCDVTDIGMVPTPVLYFATHNLGASSGVMVTGSHNPPNYNGFKIVINGHTLSGDDITALHTRIQNDDLTEGEGSFHEEEMLPLYQEYITEDIIIGKPLKIVVDCGNGVAGVVAPELFSSLGCEVIPLFCEVDGRFPNHHPDPGKPENLKDLIAKVAEVGADLGVAFDGDGDRVGVVTNEGTIINPDRLMMLFARDVVSRNPACDVIFDVKCSRRLPEIILGYGGHPVIWKTGHSLIKAKMKETGALLAGEMSGHIFFKERWFGFDDGIYSAARLLEILSCEDESSEQVFLTFPADIATPEINITVTDERKFEIISALQQNGDWGHGSLSKLDGVRVDYMNGWGLIRASNTTPVLVLRFEADTQDDLEEIQHYFRAQLALIAPDLAQSF